MAWEGISGARRAARSSAAFSGATEARLPPWDRWHSAGLKQSARFIAPRPTPLGIDGPRGRAVAVVPVNLSLSMAVIGVS